jgi:tRNA-splicing ligase RtcB
VDIGCGMCALRTNLTELDGETIRKIMGQIRATVPVGFNHQKESQPVELMPKVGSIVVHTDSIVEQEYASARKQLGTLGGGNHFIEIQYGSDGHIWIMIHSGSRNIGLKVAKHYNNLAKQLNEKWSSAVPPSWDLAFLPLDAEEGQQYLREMRYCVEFALANRMLMMERIVDAFQEHAGTMSVMFGWQDLDMGWLVNIAHNYAAMENHFGSNVMVHRKGATKASDGLIGIIPGSQGTKSYIVRGRGNPESFESCSHGAGRKLSRSKARTTLNLEDEIAKLNAAGVVHGIRNQSDLDEAAGAYKDIGEVMANQTDLVDIVVELSPLGVIKG